MKSTDLTGADAAADAHDRRGLFEARDLALGGLFGALAIVLPIAFHALGPGVGPVLLPMYLPIAALGLLVSWEVALIVGVAAPLLSAVLTGMPPLAPPIALLMAFELAALGVGAGLSRRAGLGVWPAVIIGIIASRVAGTVALLTIGRALVIGSLTLRYRSVRNSCPVDDWPCSGLQQRRAGLRSPEPGHQLAGHCYSAQRGSRSGVGA